MGVYRDLPVGPAGTSLPVHMARSAYSGVYPSGTWMRGGRRGPSAGTGAGWTTFLALLVLVGLLVLAVGMSSPKGDDTPKTPMLQKVREGFRKINSDYARIPLFHGNSSFTENKASITLCLHDPDTGRPYELNTVMYVALHELAHVITDSYEHAHENHGPQFKRNFKDLLDRATALGLYNPAFPIPKNYCGVKG